MARRSTDMGSPSEVLLIKEETDDLDLDLCSGSAQLNNSPSPLQGRLERKRSFHDSNTSSSLPGKIELTGVFKNRSGARHHGRIRKTQHSFSKQTASSSKSICHEALAITSQTDVTETSFPTQDECVDQALSPSDLNASLQNLAPGIAISPYQRGSNSVDGASTAAENTSEACPEDSISEPSLEKIINMQSPLHDKQAGMSSEAGGCTVLYIYFYAFAT